MPIAFACPGCSTRFKVADQLAGKQARCKKCGRPLQVPERPATAASVVASGLFRMGSVSAQQNNSTTATSRAAPGRASPPASLRLAPITADFVKPAARQRTTKWEEPDSVEYEMERPLPAAPARLAASHRRLLWGPGGLAESLLLGLRMVSDWAYFVSIALLLAILVAVILKQRELAIVAGVVVVLLNLARFAIDGFVLVTLAFKRGPIQGMLFFIPPWTFIYLSRRSVLREAFLRFLGPALPIAAVVLLFACVPFLRDGQLSESAPVGSETPARQETLDTQAS